MSTEFFETLDNRRMVLMFSIPFESQVAKTLTHLLELEEDNVSFGNKSGNLSMEQRVTLLCDLKAIDKKIDKPKIQAFVQIRNQFMHNQEATTFEKCIGLINGLEVFLRNNYKFDDNKTKEENFKNVYFSLAGDCSRISLKLFNQVFNKVIENAKTSVKTEAAKAFKETFETLASKSKNSDNPDLISVSEFRSMFSDLLETYAKKD